jgi:hypothetical protein
VAYSCNPRYSGNRDQKDNSWKIVRETLTGLKKNPKRDLGVTSGRGPELNRSIAEKI